MNKSTHYWLAWLLSTLFLLAFCSYSKAQSKKGRMSDLDVVYLKDNSVYRGEILEYTYGELMTLRINKEVIIKIPGNLILKVVQEAPKVKVKEEVIPAYNHWYQHIAIASLSGYFGEEFTLGLGAQYSFGYRFNRWLGTGVGAGYDNYFLGNRIAVVPVFAQIHGQFNDNDLSPTYSFKLGYGFGVGDEDIEVEALQGGIMMGGSLGFIKYKNPKLGWTFNVGYQFQDLDLRRTFANSDTYDDYEIWFQRLTVQFGLLF